MLGWEQDTVGMLDEDVDRRGALALGFLGGSKLVAAAGAGGSSAPRGRNSRTFTPSCLLNRFGIARLRLLKSTRTYSEANPPHLHRRGVGNNLCRFSAFVDPPPPADRAWKFRGGGRFFRNQSRAK